MIPTVSGTSKSGLSGPGSLNVSIPTGSKSAIAFIGSAQGAAWTVPSGWTRIGTNEHIYGIYLSPEGTGGAAWNISQSAGFQVAVLVVGFNQKVTVNQQSLSLNATSPSVTISEPSLVLRHVNDLNDSGNAITYPSSATLYRDQMVHYNSSAGWAASLGVAGEARSSSGATGTAAWTVPAAYQPGSATLALTAPDEAPASPWRIWNGTQEILVTPGGMVGPSGTIITGTPSIH